MITVAMNDPSRYWCKQLLRGIVQGVRMKLLRRQRVESLPGAQTQGPPLRFKFGNFFVNISAVISMMKWTEIYTTFGEGVVQSRGCFELGLFNKWLATVLFEPPKKSGDRMGRYELLQVLALTNFVYFQNCYEELQPHFVSIVSL